MPRPCPAGSPGTQKTGSMGADAEPMWLAEKQTGTRRLVHSAAIGVIAR